MASFSEMNTKVNVSIGLILALCVATFIVTTFYIEQVTIEERMDKRYERIMEKIHKIEKKLWGEEH
jgi:uncharacterized membrane protein (DUF485 family)